MPPGPLPVVREDQAEAIDGKLQQTWSAAPCRGREMFSVIHQAVALFDRQQALPTARTAMLIPPVR